MRGKVLGWLVQGTAWGLAAALGLVTLPVSIRALANESSLPGGEQKRTEEDRCKFLMENVSAIILTLNPEGRITFLNHYGQSFFGYSDKEVLSKPMLGTLTPVAGFEGRDMATFLAEVVRHPDQYAFSVSQNMLHSGERVWIFWANKGVSGERATGGEQPRFVLRRLHHPENSDVRRLMLSIFIHAVTMPSARARYVVGLPSWANAFSNSCLTPRASAGARAQNSRSACRLRSRQRRRA